MKVAKKIMSYKGINFELNIDVNKLIGDMKEKYVAAFTTLKNMVRSRERYIKRLHKTIKNRDHQIRALTICANIYQKAAKIYKLQISDFDVLAYMYDIEHTNFDRINNYIVAAGCKKIRKWTMLRLEKLGYILNSEKEGYYYISDSGKQIVEKVSSAIQHDMKYYLSNRISKRNVSRFASKEKAFGESKYSEDELYRRSAQYKVFMKPYWDFGKKRLPADPFIRYSILRKWMEEKENLGEKIDPVYNKYLLNIQAKMAETK
jgi:hypothetical protein